MLSELDASGRRQSRLSEKMYGAPLALPLGLSTRVTGATEDLTTALRQLAGDATSHRGSTRTPRARGRRRRPGAAEAAREPPSRARRGAVASEGSRASDEHAPLLHDPRPGLAAAIRRLPAPSAAPPGAARGRRGRGRRRARGRPADETGRVRGRGCRAVDVLDRRQPHPVAAAREPRRQARRGRADVPAEDDDEVLEGRELRRPGSVNLVEDTQVWGDRVRPIARPGDAVDPLVIDDFEVEPAADPVVGPELVAARTRLGLTVDQLAERTRIRPHVIESIEVDDFAPCGGDFYARGHLRTLARVLGVDAAPLLGPTTTGTPTPRSTRAGCSRPSWPPAPAVASAAPGAARTGRC